MTDLLKAKRKGSGELVFLRVDSADALCVAAGLPTECKSFSGTATQTAAEVAFAGGPCKSLCIENTDQSGGVLLVSMDGKESYRTVQAGGVLQRDLEASSVWVKAPTGTSCAYEGDYSI